MCWSNCRCSVEFYSPWSFYTMLTYPVLAIWREHLALSSSVKVSDL
jgi:hypothetical protein